MQQDSSGNWTSVDGRWRWDGQSWVPNPAGRWPAVPLSFVEVFSLPFSDPGWLGKCGVEGLIALIPVYGSFEILGWTLTYLDHLRAGRPDLPPARFGYAGRGAAPALVALIWGLGVLAVVLAVVGGLVAAMAAGSAQCPAGGSCASGSSAAGLVLLPLSFALPGLALLVAVGEYFLALPVILRSERLGVGQGLDLLAAARMARSRFAIAAAGAGMLFLIAFIAGFGVYACFVGVVFTYGLGAAMLGAALRWYEERIPVLPGT
ncbi:MAG TPA: hypothetical protein VNG93_14630 [Candidatus Dormibacteraeota bacterium]|nr:hypothetical protein [Candidatus Dormibacteraeota bacterium]